MPATHPPRRQRLRLPVVLYVHPFELAVVAILGTSALASGLDPQALDEVLPVGLVVMWVAANGLGILAVLVGLLGSTDTTGANPRRTSVMRGLEKAGLYLVASGTGAVLVGLVAALWPAAGMLWQPAAQLGAITLACLFRAGAIRKAERIQLETLRRLNAGDYPDTLIRPRREEPGRHE